MGVALTDLLGVDKTFGGRAASMFREGMGEVVESSCDDVCGLTVVSVCTTSSLPAAALSLLKQRIELGDVKFLAFDEHHASQGHACRFVATAMYHYNIHPAV